MLLITEVNDNVNLITEGTDGSKQYHIEGIFMEAGKKTATVVSTPKKFISRKSNDTTKTLFQRTEAWVN